MDEYLIIVFTTQTAAQTALSNVNAQMLALVQQKGYTVDNNAVIGQNAATGANDPDAQQTSTWDVVQTSPDGQSFYFSSPNNNPLLTGITVTGGTEIPFPAAWQQTGDV